MDTRALGVPRRPARRNRLGRRLVATVTTSILTLGLVSTVQAPAAAVPVENAVMVKTLLSADTYEARVQTLINKRRANRGLRRLRFITCADRTAERWSRHLAADDLFYHQSMDRVLRRCDAVYAGETLGRGGMTPRRLVRLWMNSPGHRAVLLSRKARRVGVGAVRDDHGRWVVTANFVRR